VLAILCRTGFKPDRFEFKLTESVLMEHLGQLNPLFRAMAARGIGLSIDDFGTGYSSLAYLQQINARYLKVDQRFIAAADTEKGRRLTASIVSMAHELGLEVIAEGVETPAQLDFLRGLECNYYQGYLYSRPLPPAELTDLLQTRLSRAIELS
jgi:EAL domain-containing protein (putative c-di-GMP-specific phosphodiesterase class I)